MKNQLLIFGRMVSIATARRMRKVPPRLIMLHESPSIRMPITIAVSGSNAPRMATMVLSTRRSDIVTQMLLRAVGINPSNIRFVQHVGFVTISILPYFRMAYAASINIPMKNT